MSLDCSFIQGDTVKLEFTALKADGTTINLTGATIIYRMKNPLTGDIVINKNSSGSGIAITEPLDGEFNVTLTAEETETLDGNYIHEAQITDSESSITTLSNPDLSVGKVFVRKELVI